MSHIGRVQIAKVQINVRFLAVAHVQILGHDPQVLNAALLDQVLPAQLFLNSGEFRLRFGNGFDDAGLFGDFVGAAHDDLILRDHGHGRASDRVNTDITVTAACLADLHLVPGETSHELLDELGQFPLWDADQQNRLAVLENLHPNDFTFRIHAHQRDHGLPGISGNIHDVGRQKHVTDQLSVLVRLDISRLALAGRETVGARQDILTGRVGAQIRVGGQLRR